MVDHFSKQHSDRREDSGNRQEIKSNRLSTQTILEGTSYTSTSSQKNTVAHQLGRIGTYGAGSDSTDTSIPIENDSLRRAMHREGKLSLKDIDDGYTSIEHKAAVFLSKEVEAITNFLSDSERMSSKTNTQTDASHFIMTSTGIESNDSQDILNYTDPSNKKIEDFVYLINKARKEKVSITSLIKRKTYETSITLYNEIVANKLKDSELLECLKKEISPHMIKLISEQFLCDDDKSDLRTIRPEPSDRSLQDLSNLIAGLLLTQEGKVGIQDTMYDNTDKTFREQKLSNRELVICIRWLKGTEKGTSTIPRLVQTYWSKSTHEIDTEDDIYYRLPQFVGDQTHVSGP